MASLKKLKDAINEVKEDIILHNYNDAMMLMAQITIDAIEHLADENLLVSKGYEEDLNVLHASGKISDSTNHNFETLIVSGIQAHNGVSIPEEHAKQALEVLEAELNDMEGDANTPVEVNDNDAVARTRAQNDVGDDRIYSYDEEEDSEKPAFLSNDEPDDFRKKERNRQEYLISQVRKNKINIKKLLVLITPIVMLFILIMLVKSCISNIANNHIEETTIPTTPEFFTEEEIETEPPTTTTIAGYYTVTGDLINVRAEASTGSAIRGRVNKGDSVYVESFYDDTWAIIRYEGKNAYVARAYIVKSEGENITPEENEE